MHSAVADGQLTVRYSRKKGLGGALLFAAVGVPMFVKFAAAGSVEGVTLALPFLLAVGGFLWMGLRAGPVLLIGADGLTFCRTGARLSWDEIAALEVQEWQGSYGLEHRLSVRAVHPQRFGEMWTDAPRRPWIQRPEDGRVQMPLDLMSPSAQRIAEGIGRLSGGAFASGIRRVARRPLRDPESV
jgi:hypothetical protein